jgi:predicted enzyme related to lactoylglutathione lyase
MEASFMAHPVIHFEIAAKDSNKLADFYRQMFDWPIEAGPGNPAYALIGSAGEGGIGGGILQRAGDMPDYVAFYVAVDDLEAALAKAEQLGGTRLVPPTPIPGVGAFAMFQDPEGHTVGLMKEG